MALRHWTNERRNSDGIIAAAISGTRQTNHELSLSRLASTNQLCLWFVLPFWGMSRSKLRNSAADYNQRRTRSIRAVESMLINHFAPRLVVQGRGDITDRCSVWFASNFHKHIKLCYMSLKCLSQFVCWVGSGKMSDKKLGSYSRNQNYFCCAALEWVWSCFFISPTQTWHCFRNSSTKVERRIMLPALF